MKKELMEKAMKQAADMLAAELAGKAPELAAAAKRLEQVLEDETREFTFKVNCAIKVGVNRDNNQEVEVTCSARWNTPEAIVTGTAKVSTHPELPLKGKKD